MAGPYFIPDIYEKDLGPSPNFAALAADPRIVGCIIKATQGVQYSPAWFTNNWPRARAAGGSRYGSSWFRGCYHFGMPNTHGATQADFCLAAIERAGGIGSGDMPIAWDLEGDAWGSAQQVVDISSQFAERIRARTGKTPVLYAGATVRDMRITNRMGFSKLWTPHLDMSKAGWPISDYSLWQYAGDGRWYNPALAPIYNFPTSIAGWGGTDMNVVMDGGKTAQSIAAVQTALTGGALLPLLILGAAAVFSYLYWRR